MAKFLGVALCVSCLLLNGCLGSLDYSRLANAGIDSYKAATVSDEDVKHMSMQVRQQLDSTSQLAADNSKYVKRLKKLTTKMTEVNGVPLNYKVYMTPELNADATPDGSIRVNSGLMDAMNDDELRFVIGHEIGHVAHGHALNAMRMSYVTAAAKSAGGSFHPVAGAIADSQVGELAREFVHAQYSQSQELDADAYGMDFLRANHYKTEAALSAMRKLGLEGGGFLSDHPSGEKRLQNLAALQNGADPKTLTTDEDPKAR